MIHKFNTLQKVKMLREDNALRNLRAKKAQYHDGIEARRMRQTRFDESAATLSQRENKIFDEVMQKVVGTIDIDAVKHSLLLMQKEHQQLEEDLLLAEQHCDFLKSELEAARCAFLAAQRTREKYDSMMQKHTGEQSFAREMADEAEAEESLLKGASRGA